MRAGFNWIPGLNPFQQGLRTNKIPPANALAIEFPGALIKDEIDGHLAGSNVHRGRGCSILSGFVGGTSAAGRLGSSNFRLAGVPVTGIGIQSHWSVFEPTAAELRETISRFASLGLKVQVTELDVSIYPWEKNTRARRPGEPDTYTPELQQRQAEQYKNVFAVFRDHKGTLTGVTFWNLSDRHTWLDNYPVPGRKNYPLLFDTSGQPKKAWWSVVDF